MADLSEGRHALRTVLEAGGVTTRPVPGNPPSVAVLGGSVDPSTLMAGRSEAQYRAVCIGGAWDAEASQDLTDDLTATVVSILRDAAGWRVVSIGPDTVLELTGGRVLAREVVASMLITI